MEKLLPQNIEAEAGVLGSLIIDPEMIIEVAPMLSAADFYRDAHKTIYETITALTSHHCPADFITLCDELERAGKLADVGGASYLASLINHVPTSGNAVYYAGIVSRTAVWRKLIHAAGQIAALAYGEAEGALEQAEQIVYALGQASSSTEAETLETLSYAYHARFNERYHNKGAMTGLPTGLTSLDFRLRGMHPTNMLVIAGRPGTGKTSLALAIASHTALHLEKRVAIFSLEMSSHELTNRLVAMRAGVDSQKLETPWQLTPAEYDRAIAAQTELESPNLLIDDASTMSVVEMRAKARRLKARYGIDLLIIDYVQLLCAKDERGRRLTPRNEEVAEISRSVKALAKELDIPIIALAQLSREVEHRVGKMPQLSDLKESGQLEQDADVVMMLYSEEQDNLDSTRKGQVDVLFRKHRSGVRDAIATLHYEAQYTLFTDIERRVGV